MPASRVARWDGASWSSLGGELGSSVRALTVYDDGTGAGPTLCAGGDFTTSPAADSYVARWGGCADANVGTTFCSGDGSGTPCPCGNSGGAGAGCANSTGAGAALSAAGSASIGAGDLVLSGAGLVPSQPGLYFQGDARVNGGDGAPFGDGLRCAGTHVVRIEVRTADTAGASSTTADLAAIGGVSPGDTRTYQLWYRDPPPSPCSSGFNLTNGLELVWAP